MREISIAMFLQIQSDTYLAGFLENHLTKFARRQKVASCLGPISSKITLTKRKGENCGILDWVRQYIIQTTTKR